MPKYEVGQELRVFIPRHNRLPKSPEGGWPGTVTKVGRKYMTVAVACYSEGRPAELTFDMETGRERETSGASHYHADVRTLEQVALELRMKRAREVMELFGIRQKEYFRPQFNLAQCEALAELISTHPAFIQEA